VSSGLCQNNADKRACSVQRRALNGLVQFVARGDRALWVAGGQLMVADFAGDEPRLEVHELGPWGCASLDLQGDTAYRAQGQAGFSKVTLGGP
jgi:hypothetical protein